MVQEKYLEVLDSEAETCDSDDSQEDPSFDVLEETRSRFSNLSIEKKTKSRVHKEMDEDVLDDDANGTETNAPELDAKDQKSYEIVQKIIEDGQVEKLKVEQCKLYLRKHGLRLTGKKDILINRIKEHLSIMNGEGEHKYPASSFVMYCKGDACTGDIVMFEQNVYEMFSIASRSATGPPCGTRVVAGRIVKESYGAAKQQHTFTIEVLWSKGVKPLPPLHPLLIKGRNLYRLKTMRQRWEDEGGRHRILSEKHARGNAARSDREAHIQGKELKKAFRENRATKNNIRAEKQEKKRKASPNRPMISSRNLQNPPLLSNPHAGVPYEGVLGKLPLMSMVQNHHGGSYKENINSNILRSPVRGGQNGRFTNMGFYPFSQIERHNFDIRANLYRHQSPLRSNSFQQVNNNGHLLRFHSQGQRQQLCRYYAQGRCHYGTNCKYLHQGEE